MVIIKNKPQSVISVHYFIHFGVMGVFLPYFNLYCYHLNYSELQIGILSAARVLSMVFFSIIWGIFADYIITRKSSYIICTVISTLLWSLLIYTEDYNLVLYIFED